MTASVRYAGRNILVNDDFGGLELFIACDETLLQIGAADVAPVENLSDLSLKLSTQQKYD
jgi:hypothetical protein